MSDVKIEFETEAVRVGNFARLVVAKRVAIVAAITIILNLALSNGWIAPDFSDHVLSIVTSILDGVGGLAAIAVLHPAVTPVKDPRDNEGNSLVSVKAVNVAVSNTDGGDIEVDPVVANDPGTVTPESNGMNVEPKEDSRPLPYEHS